jgi:arsenate reductase
LLGQLHSGYLITVCAKAEQLCPTFPGVGQRLFWPIEDLVASKGSAAEKLEKSRKAREELEQCIAEWLAELSNAWCPARVETRFRHRPCG